MLKKGQTGQVVEVAHPDPAVEQASIQLDRRCDRVGDTDDEEEYSRVDQQLVQDLLVETVAGEDIV